MTASRGKSRPTSVSEILESVLDSTGLNRRAVERTLLEDWPAVVGERVAAHTRAVDLEDGVLYVDADHAAWRQELTLLFPMIVEQYAQRHGPRAVREIRWIQRDTRRRRIVNPNSRGGAGKDAGRG
jgi:predicted nucleic acid-binding Zn ribbon protein